MMGSMSRETGLQPLPLRWVGRAFAALAVVGYCFVFSFFLSSAEWILAALLFGPVAGVTLLIFGFNRTALLWVLGVPSVFTYINNVAHILPSFTMGRFLFVVLLAMLTAQVFLRLRKPTPLDLVEKLSLLFLAIMFVAMVMRWVTVFGGQWRPDGAVFLTGYAMPLAAYGIARRVRWDGARQRLVLIGTAANGAFLGLVAAAQYFTGTRVFDATFIETQHANEQFERAVGTFGSSWELGLVTALCALSALAILPHTKSVSGRLLLLGLMGASLAGLGLCLTRAPWVAFVLGAGAMAVCDLALRRLVIPSAALAVMLGIVLLPIVMSSQDVASRVTDLSSIANRVALYVTSVNMILHNPVLGIGLGVNAFYMTSPDYMVNFGWIQGNWMIGVGVPHNEFLFIAVSAGLPALALYLVILARLGWSNWTAARSPEHSVGTRSLAGLALGMLIAYVFVANTLDTGLGRYASMLVFFVAGMARGSAAQQVDYTAPRSM